MKHSEITKPIGLTEPCEAIERICNSAHVYKRCGVRPKHFIIPLDSGSGRTTFLEYMTEMYKRSKVLDFSSGLDDYLEISFDGTLAQLKQAFYDIESAAVYSNNYCNIIGMDISEVAFHLGETQFEEFMKRCKEVCNHACVVFFVHSVLTKNEEKLLGRMLESIDNIEQLSTTPYTSDDICSLILKSIKDHGVEIKDHGFTDCLSEIVSKHQISSVKAAIAIAERIVCLADFSGFVPVVDENTIKLLISEMNNDFERSDVK